MMLPLHPRIRAATVLPIALLAACSVSLERSAADTDPAPDVATFFLSGIEAFNDHDVDRFMAQFAADIEMYTPTGWLRGRDAVRARFVETFDTFPDVRMVIEELRTRSVGRETVVADFRFHVYPMGQGPAFHGTGSGVYILREGRWLEVLEHETVTRTDPALQLPPR